MKRLSKKGFTLIELLIVVAIIAILAAIAVPNFLEAQTRAKVARVKADQRSLATAMESYAVDYNRHPIDGQNRFFAAQDNHNPTLYDTWPDPRKGSVWPPPPGFIDNYHWAQLTTPIAYITSPIKDPFRSINDRTTSYRQGGTHGNLQFNCMRWAKYASKSKNPAMAGKPFFRAHHRNAYNNGHAWCTFSEGPMRGFQFLGAQTNALGPIHCLAVVGDGNMKAYDRGTGQWHYFNTLVDPIYDPTNGTMSYGLIIRSTKGVITKGG